jgi:hypothetical protein
MKTQWEQFNYVDGKQKEAIIHTSGRQNAVDTISWSLPIRRDSLEVSLEASLGAISPTSPSNATVELLARLLNNNTNAKFIPWRGGGRWGGTEPPPLGLHRKD